MKPIPSLVFMVVGVILIIFGISASESLFSGISRFFTGAPTDKAIWMLIGGTVCIIIGLFGSFGNRKSP